MDAASTTTPAAASSTIGNRLVQIAIREFNKYDVQQNIRNHLVSPLMRIMYEQLMPYIITLIILILVLLLINVLTLTFVLFFNTRGFKR